MSKRIVAKDISINGNSLEKSAMQCRIAEKNPEMFSTVSASGFCALIQSRMIQ
jgi:hypothetical protein